MTTEERVLRLENAFATLSEMVAQEATRTDAVLQLVRDHDERMETQTNWINQLGSAQALIEANLSALTVIVRELGQAQSRTDERLNKLSELLAQHVHDGHS
jgi:hypothetical protein